ncbi:MAG: adenylate/guanylate cyclase [Frankiales bacterium]|nr:adenylate/guanylate cyclase [Frankiales bacterium]
MTTLDGFTHRRYARCGRAQAVRPYPSQVDSEALEAALLGAPCELTRDDVAAAVGIDETEARALWNAMGFAEVPPGERAFTTLDVEALRQALALRDLGIVDGDTLLVLARSMGQGLARMAEAQVDVFRHLSEGMSVEQATLAAGDAAADVLPRLEQIMIHVWRRQFAAATARAFVAATEDGQPLLSVGFVDLVDFTRSTQHWDSSTLERMLERFESETALRVTAVGGQVVKTLGDAVMYVADDPGAAVEVALLTVEAHTADDELPDVRAGVALGPVLVRLGDVFGQPVNIASRLTDEARPRTVLVDARTADALGADRSYDLKRLRRRSVRGYRSLTPYLLRRTGAADEQDHR